MSDVELRSRTARIVRRLLGPGLGDRVATDVDAEIDERTRRDGRARTTVWATRQLAGSIAPAVAWRMGRLAGTAGRWTVPAIDLRGVARRARRDALTTGGVVVTLGLGVAAATTVLAIVSQVLLEPLPYDRPDRIALVRADRPEAAGHPLVTGAEYAAIRGVRGIAAAAVVVAPQHLALGTPEGSSSVVVTGVGPDLLRVLGVSPAMGRGFQPEDVDAVDVAILQHAFWEELGSDPALIGRAIRLGDRPYTVVGVMPQGFELFLGRDARGGEEADVFLPVPVNLENRLNAAFRTLVRLDDGVSLSFVEDRLSAIPPEGDEVRRYHLLALQDDVVAGVRPALLALLAAVALVVAVAGLNAAGLLVARGEARRREWAMRAALGAGRPRLLALSLVESAFLAASATGLGLGLGWVALNGLLRQFSLEVPRLAEASLDGKAVVLATLFAAIVAGAFGLVPAIRAAATPPQQVLGAGGLRSASSRGGRRGLVLLQVALTFVLLAGTGLLGRSVGALEEVPLGFRPEGLFTAKVAAPFPDDGEEWWPFFHSFAGALEARPGIDAVSAVSRTPLVEQSDLDIVRFGSTFDEAQAGAHRADLRWILPNSMDVMGSRFIEGRTFTDDEFRSGAPVVVIDSAMAHALFGEVAAVGRDVHLPRRFAGEPEAARVVGVVASIRLSGLREAPRPQAFRPVSHTPWGVMTLLVRSSLPPDELWSLVRRFSDEQGARNLYAQTSFERTLSGLTSGTTVAALTVAALALIATLASALGLYSLFSFEVACRRREIGVRLAIGADPGRIVREQLAGGLRLGTVGIAAGAGVALLLEAVVDARSFGVDPIDLGIAATVVVSLLGLVATAVWLPARRAGGVDPVDVLSSD